MEYITFSYLEYASGDELIDLLKRAAKKLKKTAPVTAALSSHQNAIAIVVGFQNWSMLHKNLTGKSYFQVEDVLLRALSHRYLGPELRKLAKRTINVEDAKEEMRAWARENYTPLIEFAYYDNESPTGFGWPEVYMAEQLSDAFAGQYPEDLITEVGNALDADDGPWGDEE